MTQTGAQELGLGRCGGRLWMYASTCLGLAPSGTVRAACAIARRATSKSTPAPQRAVAASRRLRWNSVRLLSSLSAYLWKMSV
jgi:hypothetical protein